jgi:hypothetical protein
LGVSGARWGFDKRILFSSGGHIQNLVARFVQLFDCDMSQVNIQLSESMMELDQYLINVGTG